MKSFNKEGVCCPLGYIEECIAVSFVKMSQVDTEIDKKHKTFQFSKNLTIFDKFLNDFVNWNVEKGQQKSMCCPVGFKKR